MYIVYIVYLIQLESIHCLISNREGLGTSLKIMGLETIGPHVASQKEHTEIHKIPSVVLIRLVLTEIQRFKLVY